MNGGFIQQGRAPRLPETLDADSGRQHGGLFCKLQGSREMSLRIAGLIEEIGRPLFPDALADLLISAGSIAQCNVFQIGSEDSVRCLFHWYSRQAARASSYIVDQYLAGPVSADPVLRRVREEDCVKKMRSSSIFFLRSADIADKSYREMFFENRALSGKMSVYERVTRDGIYMNFYSARNRQEFTLFEIENLSWLSRIISISLMRHHEIATARDATPVSLKLGEITTLLRQGAPRLTKRELDVCSRIVAGYTTEAIALDLDISYSSVATYRRRAYGRLAISSHHELFALCLDTTLQHDPRRQ